jgi:hypothetical protein
VEDGRVGLAALALIALTKSVAVATTVVSFTILAIAATVTTLSLNLTAINRGMRQSKGSWGVVGVECLRGRCGRAGPLCEFQDQVIPDLVESRERRVALDDGSNMIVPLVQPPKNIEDEVEVRDGATEIG